ncbi:MAG: YdiU family protein [Nitratireductor sp.]
MPNSLKINFDNSYAKLSQAFFVEEKPKSVSNPTLIKFNYELAHELGLPINQETNKFSNAELAAYFSGNQIPQGATPITMAYSGHQFGHFVPTLGDGRANLMGEVIAPNGVRYDVQLKGSGPTAFSRNGDGRSALGPVIREYVVSEAMHKMHVPTTRALAMVLTGEKVQRETAMAGGILTRVAKGHIRVGTFQYFAARQDLESLNTLTNYCLNRFYSEPKNNSENNALSLLQHVISKQAALIAKWMSLGFIHGVMNTDNMSIVGETIDYGPCAFMDHYDPATVFSFIDKNGRYAYANQTSIGIWNLARLAEALLPLIDEDSEKAVELAKIELEKYEHLYHTAWLSNMGAKIGIQEPNESDNDQIKHLLEIMHKKNADFTLTFRALASFLRGSDEDMAALFDKDEDMTMWLNFWQKRLEMQPCAMSDIANEMDTINPLYIPRNHLVEEAIEAAYENDFSKMEELHKVLANPFIEQEVDPKFVMPPNEDQVVTNTFCGT